MKIPITCVVCGKVYEIESDELEQVDQHTFVAKCTCGATTQITGNPQTSAWVEINELLGKVPAILEDFRQSKMQGVDTGIGEAIRDVAKQIALGVLKEPEYRRFVEAAVRTMLGQYLASFQGK